MAKVELRSHNLLVRYEMTTWQGVPINYGEQQKGLGTSSGNDGWRTDVVPGLALYNGTG